MQWISTYGLKFCIGWLLCFGVRLAPFRPPNVEPILTTTMPFGRHAGVVGGFLFPFLSIVLFDAATSGWGLWTWITGITYGIVGIGAAVFFRNRKATPMQYVVCSVIGTLFYDAVTGLSVGPLLYDQPFMEALAGQIPFTINHLVGNIILAAVFSPLIDRWIAGNAKLEIKLPGKSAIA